MPSRGVHGGLSIAGFWSIMKRQVRMLLTRLSTNLHSRSIRCVARTLAIVALLFVSVLIGGADAFAEDMKLIFQRSSSGGYVRLNNSPSYISLPSIIQRVGKEVPGADAINNDSQDVMEDGDYGNGNYGEKVHSTTEIKLEDAKAKEEEEAPNKISSPSNQNTCTSCGNSGSKGPGGFGGKKPFGGQGPFRRIISRLVGGRGGGRGGGGGGGGGGCSGGSCSGGGFSGGGGGGCANGVCNAP
jgi:hypothetical protein